MAVKYGSKSTGGFKKSSKNSMAKKANAGKKYVSRTLQPRIKKAFGKPGMRQPRFQGAGNDGVRSSTKGGR